MADEKLLFVPPTTPILWRDIEETEYREGIAVATMLVRAAYLEDGFYYWEETGFREFKVNARHVRFMRPFTSRLVVTEEQL